jgi:hypothetical protein
VSLVADDLWLDTYDCGHTQRVESMVPIDRQVRVGEPVVCYVCKDAGEFHVRQRVKVERLEEDDERA